MKTPCNSVDSAEKNLKKSTIKKITLSAFIVITLLVSFITFKTVKPTFREFKSCLKQNTGTNYSKFINDYIN